MLIQIPQEIFEWISNIINSCTNDFHFEACDRLIELFKEKEKDENLYTELLLKRSLKWNEIHSIIDPTLNK